MPNTYYNDNEHYVAQWLRNLADGGQITPGFVDQRRIEEVQPHDVQTYARCHFFAGIGGWDLALQLAGWPADQPVWTGSCPCQPFSVAGKQRGVADPRHLWPEWFRLIRECRPATIFGEQVASRDGREWLNGVFADLESVGYAVAGADLCAAGVGAPHIRQRLWWVAHSQHPQWRPKFQEDGDSHGRDGLGRSSPARLYGAAAPCGCWDPESWHRKYGMLPEEQCGNFGDGVADHRRFSSPGRRNPENVDGSSSSVETPQKEWQWLRNSIDDGSPDGWLCQPNSPGRQQGQQASAPSRHWDSFVTAGCLDGKSRRIEPGLQPLAHGVPARVAKLRAIGNSIVPQVAAEFIQAVMAYLQEQD